METTTLQELHAKMEEARKALADERAKLVAERDAAVTAVQNEYNAKITEIDKQLGIKTVSTTSHDQRRGDGPSQMRQIRDAILNGNVTQRAIMNVTGLNQAQVNAALQNGRQRGIFVSHSDPVRGKYYSVPTESAPAPEPTTV